MEDPARGRRPRHEAEAAARPPAPRARRGAPPAGRASATRTGRGAGGSPDAPVIADDADPAELPDDVRRELRSLPPALAERVARHLVMAGRLLEDDPAAAHGHTAAARGLAARLAVVREAAGVTAYRSARYAEALGELRALRRMTGSAEYLPVMADCERGLGRPERALALAEDPAVRRLDRAGQVEMRIVAAGARRDLGQVDAALMTLRAGSDLDRSTVEDWTPRLWYAYADALLAADREQEAREWFLAAASVDDDGLTDAEERLAVLGARSHEKRPDHHGPERGSAAGPQT